MNDSMHCDNSHLTMFFGRIGVFLQLPSIFSSLPASVHLPCQSVDTVVVLKDFITRCDYRVQHRHHRRVSPPSTLSHHGLVFTHSHLSHNFDKQHVQLLLKLEPAKPKFL